MLGCEHLADAAPDGQDLCARSWAWGLAAAWVTSPVFAFAAFVLMGRLMAAVKAWTEPTILTPKKGLRAGATSAESFRVCTINMCLLPGGFSFAGSWLFDGDDKKSERIDMLLAILDDYDVIMLNEMWGCWWSSYHTDFFERASERGRDRSRHGAGCSGTHKPAGPATAGRSCGASAAVGTTAG